MVIEKAVYWKIPGQASNPSLPDVQSRMFHKCPSLSNTKGSHFCLMLKFDKLGPICSLVLE